MKQIYSAISIALRDQKLLFIFAITSAIFFALFITIPVWTIPANTLSFQLKTFRTQDYFLMTFLSLVVGLNLVLQIYSLRQRKNKDLPQSVLQSTASGGLGVFGAIIGTATCVSCLASLFALVGLGTGGVFFVLQNQTLFLLVAVLVILVSLYFAAKKVNKVCNSC